MIRLERKGDLESIYKRIRPATKDDLDSVYRLIRQLSTHTFSKEQFEDCYLFHLGERSMLVYEKDHFICGCLAYDIHYPMHLSRKSAEIVNLIVDETYRGQGVGKELLNYFEQIAAENGCVCIEVDSNKKRKNAHRFYIREGFAFNHYKFTKEL